MTSEELRMIWEKEESIAQIKGWDFSHIHGRITTQEEVNSCCRSIIPTGILPRQRVIPLTYSSAVKSFCLWE